MASDMLQQIAFGAYYLAFVVNVVVSSRSLNASSFTPLGGTADLTGPDSLSCHAWRGLAR